MICNPMVWRDALRRLQDEIPDFAFEAWIRPLAVKIDANRVALGCPSSFHRDRVRLQFHERLEQNLDAVLGIEARSNDGSATKTAATLQVSPSPRIELLCMSEFANAPGHAIDIAALEAEKGIAGREGVVASAEQRMRSAKAVGQATVHVAGGHVAGGQVAGGHAAEGASGGAAFSSGGAGSTGGPGSSAVPGIVHVDASPASAFDGTSNGRSKESHLEAVPDRRGSRSTGTVAAGAAPNTKSGQAKSLANSIDASRSSESKRFAGKRRVDAVTGPDQPELPFSFESFVVGPCNALAREAALALARTRQRSLNLLYLGGESGMGKTHLARATAAEARRHGMPSSPPDSAAGAKTPSRGRRWTHPPFDPPHERGNAPGVVYTSAERFTSDFVSAMRNGHGDAFKRRYRGSIGLLIVEDIQFFSGRVKTQLELFHTLQHVLDAGGRVLLTGDRTPRELTGLDERVRAQVGRGFVAELERPDAIVRRHILRSKAAAGGVGLPDDCLDLLVEASQGSVRDIESMLIQVVTTSSLLGRSIDLALTEDAIALKTSADSVIPTKTVAVSEIVRIVSAFFGKRPELLASKSRRRDVLVPRQLAMYLAHRYTDASFAEIGRGLGRRHPSVRNAIERIERQVLENAPVRYQVEALSERIDATLKEAGGDAPRR